MATMVLTMYAQGHNRGMGGPDGDYKSLAQRVFKLEKKTDAINIYFNYASSFQAADNVKGDKWGTSFKNKQARIEIKGDIGKHISYRFRHRLNKANNAQSEDNFAKATDILMVGYQFNDHFGIQGGKCVRTGEALSLMRIRCISINTLILSTIWTTSWPV